MAYDDPETIQKFHVKWGITHPLLADVDGEHVDAWGIRNEQCGPGTFVYNIPHPGAVLLSPEGEILAEGAEPGYRFRADWITVFKEVRALVRGQ